MIGAGSGLREVATSDLQKMLRAVHRGDLGTPLTIEHLTRCGLQHCATDLLSALRKVDDGGLRAVLVCVLAERRG